MKLQDHINSTDLNMSDSQVKAFLLGVISAEKPMPFSKALDELCAEAPEAKSALEAPMKECWEYLKKNYKAELEKMFPREDNIVNFMEIAREQLDYFLTALSLSGTNTENCSNEELASLIEELEDSVEDLDDFLADSNASPEDGEDFKEFLLGTWSDFTAQAPQELTL